MLRGRPLLLSTILVPRLRKSCARPLLLPTVTGQFAYDHYTLCWHQALDQHCGPFGQRRPCLVGLLDPRIVDVNWVVGQRSRTVDPFIAHHAGNDKHHLLIALRDAYGPDAEAVAQDCRRLGSLIAQETSPCTPPVLAIE